MLWCQASVLTCNGVVCVNAHGRGVSDRRHRRLFSLLLFAVDDKEEEEEEHHEHQDNNSSNGTNLIGINWNCCTGQAVSVAYDDYTN